MIMYDKQGGQIDKDCSGDSVFMKMMMRIVANKIHNYSFWVPLTTTICLMIDNTGGHRTNGTIEEYRNMI